LLDHRVQGRADQRAQSHAAPILGGQGQLRITQGAQARLESVARLGLDIPKGLPGDGLHIGKRVLDAMLEFGKQKIALLLGLLVVGNVAEHDAEAVTQREQPVGEPTSGHDHGSRFRAHGLAACHRLQEETAKARFTCAWEQLPEVAPEHLGRCAPEMARSLAIETAHAPIAIDGIKALADAFQDDAKLGFRVAWLTGTIGNAHAELVARHTLMAGVMGPLPTRSGTEEAAPDGMAARARKRRRSRL